MNELDILYWFIFHDCPVGVVQMYMKCIAQTSFSEFTVCVQKCRMLYTFKPLYLVYFCAIALTNLLSHDVQVYDDIIMLLDEHVDWRFNSSRIKKFHK